MQNASASVLHTHSEFLSFRFVSGRTIYDEALIGGVPVGRYWSDSGQIWPEMHLPPESLPKEADEFPLSAFELIVNGKRLNAFTFIETGER